MFCITLYPRGLYFNAFVLVFFLLEHKGKLHPRISVVSMAQHLWADKPQLCERGELDLSTAIFKFILYGVFMIYNIMYL